MNNLKILRDFFNLSTHIVADELEITEVDLIDFENSNKIPTILEYQKFAEYYSNLFNVSHSNKKIQKPIHMRLSIDYLMNIGITMTDLLAFKWYFDNKRPELGEFSICLYNQNTRKLESKYSNLHDIFDKFAGYILLNHNGTLNSFIDENNNNYVSDWRFVLYKNDNLIIDITSDLSYFNDLINYTIM